MGWKEKTQKREVTEHTRETSSSPELPAGALDDGECMVTYSVPQAQYCKEDSCTIKLKII